MLTFEHFGILFLKLTYFDEESSSDKT